MTVSKHPKVNENDNGNKEKLPVLGLQVLPEAKEYFENFCKVRAYASMSNALAVHLRVAMHLYLKKPDEFSKLITDSSYIVLAP